MITTEEFKNADLHELRALHTALSVFISQENNTRRELNLININNLEVCKRLKVVIIRAYNSKARRLRVKEIKE